MSSTPRDEGLMKALAERARARAAEQRAIEAPLSEGAPASGIDRIAAALEEQVGSESAVRPARRPVLAWLAVAGIPLAAAATIAIAHRGGARGTMETPAEYVVSVSGHVETQRGAGDVTYGSLQARPDAIEEVILRPRERSARSLAAKVLVVRDGVSAPLDVATEVSDAGVVRFELSGTILARASEVRVAIAPPAELEEAVIAAREGTTPRGEGESVVRVPIEPAPAPRP